MYNDNYQDDFVNAYLEIIEDFNVFYMRLQPQEEEDRPRIELENIFAGAKIYTESVFKIFQPNQYKTFVECMKSIDYDSGYGDQELYGFVLLNDNTWFERYSYDGKEWWVHKKRPELHKII